jgi:glycosyltransferase involved in cell wall biosynthesis
MPEPWAEVKAAGEWLLELADLITPDLVHLNGYVHATLPWPAPVLVVAHSDVLSWWSAVRGEAAPAEWSPYRDRVRAGLLAADAVVAPTAAVLDDLRRGYDVTGGTVIPNGRDARFEGRAPAKESLILGAGRVWDEAKNLRVLAALGDRVTWPVAVAGDPAGPHARGDAAPGTTLLGRLAWPELATWLRRASIFAAPACYEPFGLGPLEAAQAGCALVLGDIPSLREIWGDAARYVPPRDEDALAAALQHLIDDPTARADLAQRARHRAGDYTVARMTAGYLDAYAGLPTTIGATS